MYYYIHPNLTLHLQPNTSTVCPHIPRVRRGVGAKIPTDQLIGVRVFMFGNERLWRQKFELKIHFLTRGIIR